MPEFLGENTDGLKRGQPAPKAAPGAPALKKPPEIPTRRERPKPRSKSGADLTQFARDFKSGLVQLGSATDRLSRQQLAERVTPRKLLELRKQAPSVARILERELKTVERLVKANPDIKHTALITKTFRTRAERVIEQRLPQLYASILKAEQMVTKVQPAQPAKIAMPLKKGAPVEALVKAARAIRAGRLPFLPLETRKKAQALIDRVFSKSRSLAPQRLPSSEQRQLIERHNLIPLSVKHDVVREVLQRSPTAARQVAEGKALPPALAKPVDRQVLRTVNELMKEQISRVERETTIETRQQAAPTPPTVVTRDMPQTPQAVPSFASQGAAAGGDYMAHTGEDLHVISRNDRPLVEPHEQAAAPAAAPAPASRGRSRASTGPGGVPAAIPQARAPAPRTPAMRGAQSSTGGPGGLQSTDSDKPREITGTLEIAGLADWVAKIEGRTKQ